MDERIQRKNAEDLFRGSGNYSSEEAKEIVRFKKEFPLFSEGTLRQHLLQEMNMASPKEKNLYFSFTASR